MLQKSLLYIDKVITINKQLK